MALANMIKRHDPRLGIFDRQHDLDYIVFSRLGKKVGVSNNFQTALKMSEVVEGEDETILYLSKEDIDIIYKDGQGKELDASQREIPREITEVLFKPKGEVVVGGAMFGRDSRITTDSTKKRYFVDAEVIFGDMSNFPMKGVLFIDTGSPDNYLVESYFMEHLSKNGRKVEKCVDTISASVRLKVGSPSKMVFTVRPKTVFPCTVITDYKQCIGLLGYEGLAQCQLWIMNNSSIICEYS